MKLTAENLKDHYMHIDFYLEEILRLSLESDKDERSKFKLFEIIIYHK
jgi:hypothetical protein